MKIHGKLVQIGVCVALILVPAVSWGHPADGSGGGGMHGLLHPVGGLDHVLAMLGIGLIAARMGGRALALIPASFVAMMVVGVLVGTSLLSSFQIEMGIGVSVIVVGMLVAAQGVFPIIGIMALVGGFGLLHGFAHGPSLAGSVAPVPYIAGFLITTTVAVFAGLGLSVMCLRRTIGNYSIRTIGTTIGLVGVGIVAQGI